jgi:hypothetical protein
MLFQQTPRFLVVSIVHPFNSQILDARRIFVSAYLRLYAGGGTSVEVDTPSASSLYSSRSSSRLSFFAAFFDFFLDEEEDEAADELSLNSVLKGSLSFL